MCEGITRIRKVVEQFDVWLISYNEGDASPSKQYFDQKIQNDRQLYQAVNGLNVQNKDLVFWKQNSSTIDEENHSRFVGEVNACKIIKAAEDELKVYTDIIVDISALPQTIYLCIINTLFKCCPSPEQKIYIVTTENYSTDMHIKPVQADETAHEIQGFSSPSDDLNRVVIWFPILGENNMPYLDKYYNFLKSHSKEVDEICPVVPFPSENVRRADDVLYQYSKRLFDDWSVDKKNIMYASETNPLLLCKNLYEASINYKEALAPLGETKFVFSAITSKLMTVGMLLAAFDLKSAGYSVSVLGVNNKGYHIDEKAPVTPQDNLVCLAV